jgi:hypothetical protein
MYRCEQCERVIAAGIRVNRVTVETREKTYESRGNRERERVRRGGRRVVLGRKARRRQIFDKGGRGNEIVKEISVCPDCAQQHKQAAAEAAAALAAVAVAE